MEGKGCAALTLARSGSLVIKTSPPEARSFPTTFFFPAYAGSTRSTTALSFSLCIRIIYILYPLKAYLDSLFDVYFR